VENIQNLKGKEELGVNIHTTVQDILLPPLRPPFFVRRAFNPFNENSAYSLRIAPFQPSFPSISPAVFLPFHRIVLFFFL
jgi:hypothetical protein